MVDGRMAGGPTDATTQIDVWTPTTGAVTVATGDYQLLTTVDAGPSPAPGGRRRKPPADAGLPPAYGSNGLLIDPEVGPMALLRTMAAADGDTTVYVVADRRALLARAGATAGTVVLARRVGAVVLEVDTRPGESAVARAVRDYGLVRRHANLSLQNRTSALPGPVALRPPVALPVTVPVQCRILDADGLYTLVAVDDVHRLVPRDLVTATSAGFGTIHCKVLDLGRSPVRLEVPGIPVDGPELARTTFVGGKEADASRLGPPAALGAAPAMTVAFLIATKNGATTVADTIRSADAQGPVYVVSDGSDDDTVAVAEAAGAQVLHLERNVGKPTALRTAINTYGLTRRYDAIAILDDDTIIDPDFLTHCRAALQPGVAIAVGKTLTRWDEGHKWNVWLASRAYGYWRYQATLRRGQSALNVMTCISGSNSVYRSELLDEVLVEQTPYIVDDTYWTLETHRRKLGRIVYVPEAQAHICDPTNLRDWYKQNLRWIWGSFQGVWGHRVGRQASLFDVTYVMQILDWLMYVLLAPMLIFLALWYNWIEPETFVKVTFLGYGVGAGVAAAVLKKWRLAAMAPALILVDWLYRIIFMHAFVKTIRQPRVETCRWESPTRYV
jgi:poly-beta-1,6-N-acetyl-D-glucosamine synthase